MTPRDTLEVILAQKGLNWSESDKAIVAEAIVNAASVSMRHAAGENVEHLWPQIAAQVLGITSAAAQSAANVFQVALMRTINVGLGVLFGQLGLPAVPR